MRPFAHARAVPIAALALMLSAAPSMAQAHRTGPDLGGGFIEFLFNSAGGESAPAPPRPRFDPLYEPQRVGYAGPEAPGTVVIDTTERFLYLVEPGGTAMRYGVGVGRAGFEWHGTETIARKAEWPEWRPPADMLRRRPDLPAHMPGGPGNPLGARALYLGNSLYRIHGSNEPRTIGQAVSSGCIRMRNEDVIDLYGRVRVGTRVVVL